jgi:phosphonate transport system substrate-binding protein
VIAPVISPEQSVVLYEDFTNHIAEQLDRHPVLLQGKNYADVNNMVRHRQCDLAMVCTLAYVRGQEEFGMEAVAAPVVDGRAVYHSLIITQTTSKTKTLLDFRQKRFGGSDILSASGWAYPVVWLKTRGEDPTKFFSEHFVTGSHDRSVRAVASDFVDGAAVDSVVYESMAAKDPSLQKGIKILDRSEPYGMPPLVVHGTASAIFKKNIQRIIINMHLTEKGRKALAVLDIDRFEKPSEKAYDAVRHLAKVLDSSP